MSQYDPSATRGRGFSPVYPSGVLSGVPTTTGPKELSGADRIQRELQTAEDKAMVLESELRDFADFLLGPRPSSPSEVVPGAPPLPFAAQIEQSLGHLNFTLERCREEFQRLRDFR